MYSTFEKFTIKKMGERGREEKTFHFTSCSHEVDLLFLHNISNRKCKIQAQLILRVGSVLIVHKTAKVTTDRAIFLQKHASF